MAALAAAAGRQLTWGLRTAAGEVARYTHLAARIPEKPIRQDAMAALARKRPHLDGAALFSILPPERNPRLVHALLAYELILEFLDNTNERAAHAGVHNGLQLHRALEQALNPHGAVCDHYRYHPWREDGGYLHGLVQECRRACVSLPRYQAVQRAAITEARRARVLALNHHPDPACRDVLLRAWAARELPAGSQARWWELTGTATASLSVHALLTLAAAGGPLRPTDIQKTRRAYRQLSLIATMLDSYVDERADLAGDQHSYISHYSAHELPARLCELIQQSLTEVRALPSGHRHAVIAASMIALYLSNDAARTPARRATTNAILDAGGSLTRLLLPVLRAWRAAYGLRNA